MKRRSAFVLTLALAASAALAADVKGFKSSWPEAVKVAEAQNKPIYLHFTTEWCGWCRRIEQDTYANPKGKKALESFVPASLDCTRPEGGQPTDETKRNLELLAKWGGTGYPYLVMVTPDGGVLNTVSGYLPPEKFVEETNKALEVWNQLQAFEEYAAGADKDSHEYNARALKVYLSLRQWDKAVEAAEKVRELDPDNQKGDLPAALFAVARHALAQGKAQNAREAARKLAGIDPANASGYLEKVVWELAKAELNSLDRSASPAQREKAVNAAISALQPLTGESVKLSDGVNLYFFLGNLNAAIHNHDKAEAAWNKALAMNPSPRARQVLRQRIEQIQQHEH